MITSSSGCTTGVDVLAMVRAGTDRESFAAVFNAHHRQAVRLAYLLTSDPHQAEDVVADAFAKVYVRWQRGEVRDVGAYLRRAVANEANSKLRRRYLERREASKRSGDDRGVRTVDDSAADHDQVWQAIQRLPDRQRRAVVLRYYEDLSEAETAEILGCSVGTVKSQVSRGLARMRELLAAPGGLAASSGGGGH
jgi:RNA polymerase sigma-70 factor (sigma-E family)